MGVQEEAAATLVNPREVSAVVVRQAMVGEGEEAIAVEVVELVVDPDLPDI
jgi:hypothetical protein